MLFGKLSFVFEVMIYVGLGLPLVNLLLGLITGGDTPDAEIEADVDLDGAGEIEVGEAEIEVESADAQVHAGVKGFPVKFNVYCLCLAFVIAGAVGVFALETKTGVMQLVVLCVGIVCALLAYCLLYRFFILPLKKNDAAALKADNLRYRHAKVTFRITKDSPGTIETRDAVGAIISYRAELDPDVCKLERIDEQEEVIITDVRKEENLCYVSLAQRKILD